MVTTYIKNNPLSGKSPEAKQQAENQDPRADPLRQGVAGDVLNESKVRYNQTPGEEVIQGKSDSYIVLGRDRWGNPLQGRGGQGEANAAAIDIIVGRYSGAVPETDSQGTVREVDPSFSKDAARIYISQKTDIDDCFHIARGKIGTYQNRSAIAIKADGIRLLSREGIKLVTKNDKFNTKGIEPTSCGIDLIALNDDSDLQPIPKGNNLVAAFDKLTKHVSDLNKIVQGFLVYQMKMNLVIQEHVHVGFFDGKETSPSAQLSTIHGPYVMKDLQGNIGASLKINLKEIQKFKLNFITKGQKKYINSEYNNTN